jgi:hypothetical protein
MKKIIFLTLFFIISCDASEYGKVESFSENIKQLIVSKDRNKFGLIHVFPKEHISNDSLSYIFGEAVSPGVGEFLKQDQILVKIYGPYSRDDADGHKSYSIVYYDPHTIKHDNKGHFSSSEMKSFWGSAYLETVVTIVDNKVLFHRTPFYYGTHAPWAEDY